MARSARDPFPRRSVTLAAAEVGKGRRLPGACSAAPGLHPRLEDHPNLADDPWGPGPAPAHPRRRAGRRWPPPGATASRWPRPAARRCRPDSPLVMEVLAAFDALADLFADDLAGDADFVAVDPQVTVARAQGGTRRDRRGLRQARPVPHRVPGAARARGALVYPRRTAAASPTSGPRAARMRALLSALPAPRGRAATTRSRARRSKRLVDHRDDAGRGRAPRAARERAFRAAVLTGRRRTWALVRRSAAEGLGRYCTVCRTSGAPDESRVRRRAGPGPVRGRRLRPARGRHHRPGDDSRP